MIQNLFNDMTELLRKQAPDFFVNDKFNKNKVTDAAYSYDKNLLKALLTNDSLKKQFFVEVEKNLVFKQREFLMFLNNKSFLQDSYTRFKNEIGLQDEEGRYFRENTDVVLVWPHKDCILEGGQTKEDQSREEVFYNETLAPDEIDRLLDTKALTNFSLFDKNGKKELKANTELNLREQNLIIRGNNLLALHSLKARKDIAGKVKLIYIDPPYNTGNDEFKYNDSYNHSTWLTFMKNRLGAAKELLSKDGVIFIQCDDNEQPYLKVLADEVFKYENFVNSICVKMSEASGVKMNHAKKRFPKIKEYILFYKKSNQFKGFETIDKYQHPVWDKENNIFLENITKEQREKLIEIEEKDVNDENDLNAVNAILKKVKKVSLSQKLKELETKDCDEIEKWKFENSFRIIKTAGSASLAKAVKSYNTIPGQDIAAGLSAEKILFYYITDFNREAKSPRLQVIFADTNIFRNPCDFWQDIKTTGAIADEGGVKLEKGKKPEKLIERIIKMTTKENDIVLDYHLGSGTTAAVAHKMNRRYIGMEQLDYGENDSVNRLINVINGDQTGISQLYNWQGGGSFLYCELKEFNQKYIKDIQSAKKGKDLWKIWDTMKSEAFLRIEIDKDKFTEDSFNQLEVDEQKRLLVETLDKNHLYVNLSEMEDEEHKMTKDEIELNKKFYNIS